LGIQLPDLLSRLQSGLIHGLIDFGDDDLRRLLQFRSNLRGMYLSDEVARFLLTRLSRDTKTLLAALETLDSASLREQRRLTTPFVKTTLDI
jgi:DnaA family protein